MADTKPLNGTEGTDEIPAEEARSAPARPSHPNRPVVGRTEVNQLRSHPCQAELYDAATDAEVAALVQSLETDGQRDALECLPPGNAAGLPAGTLLDGHRRRDAALQLGWTHLQVRVRWDLLNATREAVDAIYLQANLVRRHLNQLDRAGVMLRLLELERRHPGSVCGTADGDVRDRIGTMVNLCGRHVDRLLNVARTPRPVQRAVRERRLSIVLAEKVAALDPSVQEEIAEKLAALADGKGARALVRSYVGSKGRTKDAPATRLIRDLSRVVASARRVTAKNLKGHEEELAQVWRSLDVLVKKVVGDRSPDIVSGSRLNNDIRTKRSRTTREGKP
jgi:ParB-like chromosome segregation protein Spo0J